MVDTSAFLDIWTHEELVKVNNMAKEVAFRQCDRVTRETGRLTKLIIVNDLRNKTSAKPDSKVMKAMSESSHLSEFLYPQLVEATIAVNAGPLTNLMFKAAKLFVSKRAMSKFKVCHADTLTGDIKDCPYASKHIAIENIPSYLGGTCRCDGGCIVGMKNDQTEVLVPSAEQVGKVNLLIDELRAKEREQFRLYLEPPLELDGIDFESAKDYGDE
jgi:hypothetical protein